MSEVRIIATVIAKENEVAYVRAAAESIVKSSYQEEGCLQYELHQLHDNSNTFVFFEVWQSQKAVDKHNNTLHFNEFISQVKDRVELLDVKLMSKIA